MLPIFDIKVMKKAQIAIIREEIQRVERLFKANKITAQQRKKRRGYLLGRLSEAIGSLMQEDTDGRVTHIPTLRTNTNDSGYDYERILDPYFDYFSYVRSLKR